MLILFLFNKKDAKRRRKKPGPIAGWIYCLCNPSFPDKVKIGYTTTSVEDRMAQLDSTGTPTPFRLVGKWRSRDVIGDERRIHRKLAKFRIRTNREFFTLHARDAAAKITDILDRPTQEKLARRRHNGLAQGLLAVLVIVAVIWGCMAVLQ